jgi:hypothetical protein
MQLGFINTLQCYRKLEETPLFCATVLESHAFCPENSAKISCDAALSRHTILGDSGS